jgi:hypothetical protein
MFFSKRACNALSSSSRCFADKSLFAFAPFIAISSSLIVSCYDDLFTPFFSGQFLGPISSKRIVDEGDGLSHIHPSDHDRKKDKPSGEGVLRNFVEPTVMRRKSLTSYIVL